MFNETQSSLTNCYFNLLIYYTNILLYSDYFKWKKYEPIEHLVNSIMELVIIINMF